VTDFEGQVLGDLRVLKSQMEQVMGIGQPGRLGQIEDRVMKHDQSLQRIKGSAAAFGGFLTLLHVAIDFVAKR
jgi:hypothetical protein